MALIRELKIDEFDRILRAVPPHTRDVVIGKKRYENVLTNEEAAFVEILNAINITIKCNPHYAEHISDGVWRERYVDNLMSHIHLDFDFEFVNNLYTGQKVEDGVHFLRPMRYINASVHKDYLSACVLSYLSALYGYKVRYGVDKYGRLSQELEGAIKYDTVRDEKDEIVNRGYVVIDKAQTKVPEDEFIERLLSKINGDDLRNEK